MSSRRAFADPLATRGPTIAPGHFRSRSAFIVEHQTFHRDLAYRRPPRLAPGVDRRRILFLGVERLFLSRSPIPCNTRQRC